MGRSCGSLVIDPETRFEVQVEAFDLTHHALPNGNPGAAVGPSILGMISSFVPLVLKTGCVLTRVYQPGERIAMKTKGGWRPRAARRGHGKILKQ